MNNEKGSGAVAFVVIVLVILFLAFLISGGSNSDRPSSSTKSTYEKTMQKAKDGVPLTNTEKKFLDSYIKAGY